MKRKLGAIILVVALVLALVVPAAPAAAHVEGSPQVKTLFAGQDIPVGTVSVWNDEDNLYVTYEITDLDWVITETHLYVGQNNPNELTTAPGQFPYDDADAASVTDTEVTYEILLTDIDGYHMQLNKKGKPTGVMVADGDPGVVPCNDVYIAAQAEVERTETGTFMPELTWQRSTESEEEVVSVSGYGASWDVADAFDIDLDGEQIVWDDGTYHMPPGVSPGTSWASWDYACVPGLEGSYNGNSDLRRFQATFNVPDGYTVTAGSLYAPHFTSGIPINDNVYIFINSDGSDYDLLFWGGTRVYTDEIGPDFLGITGTAAARGATEPKETDRWYIPGTIPSVTSFTTGTNYIDIFTEENERWGGMGKLVLELDYEETFSETAWGSGTDFEHPNWAMYFEYHVQLPVPEGLVLWLDAGVDVTQVGGKVSEWADQSEEGNDATQAVEEKQPTHVANELNEKPVVRFDGINDFLSTGAFDEELTQPTTILGAWKISDNTGASQVLIDGITSDKRNCIYYSEPLSDKHAFYAGTIKVGTVLSPPGSFMVSTAVFDGADSVLYLNGVVDVEEDVGSQGLTGASIGASYIPHAFLNGDIAEILIFNRALSDTEREAVEDYLMAKYDL